MLVAKNWEVVSKTTRVISKAYFAGVYDNSLSGFYTALNVLKEHFKGQVSVDMLEVIMSTDELMVAINKGELLKKGGKSSIDEFELRNLIESDLKVYIRYLSITEFKTENTYQQMTNIINNFIAVLLRASVVVDINRANKLANTL
jgi:hypothetical protein